MLSQLRFDDGSVESPNRPVIRSLPARRGPQVAAQIEVAAGWGGPLGPRTDTLVGPMAEGQPFALPTTFIRFGWPLLAHFSAFPVEHCPQ